MPGKKAAALTELTRGLLYSALHHSSRYDGGAVHTAASRHKHCLHGFGKINRTGAAVPDTCLGTLARWACLSLRSWPSGIYMGVAGEAPVNSHFLSQIGRCQEVPAFLLILTWSELTARK